MQAPISQRLGQFVGEGKPLPIGNRWRSRSTARKQADKCDCTFTVADKARAGFDTLAQEAARRKEDLISGDAVLRQGTVAQLVWYDEATGRRRVTFSCHFNLVSGSEEMTTANAHACNVLSLACYHPHVLRVRMRLGLRNS